MIAGHALQERSSWKKVALTSLSVKSVQRGTLERILVNHARVVQLVSTNVSVDNLHAHSASQVITRERSTSLVVSCACLGRSSQILQKIAASNVHLDNTCT